MSLEWIQSFLDEYPLFGPWVVGSVILVMVVAAYLLARHLVVRGLVYQAARTRNQYDDILVTRVRLSRLAWIAPLLIIYYTAGLLTPGARDIVHKVVLFLILWLAVLTISGLLRALNTIYEASRFYKGESIQGYLDLLQIAQIAVALILTISLFTDRSPWVLLSGLGAAMAVLLLVFHDTLLSLVASVQIQINDLIKEGDWIEVPSYGGGWRGGQHLFAYGDHPQLGYDPDHDPHLQTDPGAVQELAGHGGEWRAADQAGNPHRPEQHPFR